MTERNSHTMRKRLLAVSLAAIVPFSLAGVASAADGQYLLAPPSGLAGTVVTASDADGDCAVPEGSPDPFVILVIASDQALIADNDVDLVGTGAFTVSATIPASTPAGTYDVFVACFADRATFEDDEPFFEFPDRTFVVTAPVVTAPPVVSPPRPAGPAAARPAPAAPKAKPASAVKAQPRFTG